MKRLVSGIMLTLLLVCMLTLAFNAQPVRGSETIHIRADGSVDPPTAPLRRSGDTYMLTDNIMCDAQFGIDIERDNMTLDGAGYSIHGSAATLEWGSGSEGIDLFSRVNVTVKSVNIDLFKWGIRLLTGSDCIVANSNITNSLKCGIHIGGKNNTIVGNNITNNVTNNISCGIMLENSSNNTIFGNNIVGNQHGIYMNTVYPYPPNYDRIIGNNITENWGVGLLMLYSQHCYIAGNNLINNWRGIVLSLSSDNNIIGNNATNNDWGIVLDPGSYGNTLRTNKLDGNNYGLEVHTHDVPVNDVDVSNTVNGKPIYYWINKADMTVPVDAGYVVLANCTGILVQNLNLTRNGEGVLLVYTKNSTITNNDLTYNYDGIQLQYSNNNTISNNNISHNSESGIYLTASADGNTVSENYIANNEYGVYIDNTYSAYNFIFHNNFVHNDHQTNVHDGRAVWDDSYPSGGNYWSDYADVDLYCGAYQNETGSDGIWDHPYQIGWSEADRYPLVNPCTVFLPTDVNRDGAVNIMDIAIVAKAYGSKLGDLNWNPIADVSTPYGEINIMDVAAVARDYGKTT